MSDDPTNTATDAQMTQTLDQLLAGVSKASSDAGSGPIAYRESAAQTALLLAQAYARIVAPDAPQAALLPDTTTSTDVHQVGLLNRS